MPDDQIAAVTAWTSPKGRAHKLPQSLPAHLVDRISAELLLVKSRKLGGSEINTCLKEAYDACATVLQDTGRPLTDNVLTEIIPAWILRWALIQGWYLLMPDDKSDVVLGDLMIGDSTRADFLKRLRSRIAYWQAISLKQAATQPAKPRGDISSVVVAVPNVSDRKGQIDALIAEVFKRTGRHINRTHIWKAGGYKEATQFERFQSGKKTTNRSLKIFAGILAMAPVDFVDRLKSLKLLD